MLLITVSCVYQRLLWIISVFIDYRVLMPPAFLPPQTLLLKIPLPTNPYNSNSWSLLQSDRNNQFQQFFSWLQTNQLYRQRVIGVYYFRYNHVNVMPSNGNRTWIANHCPDNSGSGGSSHNRILCAGNPLAPAYMTNW